VLADGAISRRLDAFAFDPIAKATAVEDAIAVADDVLGDGAGASDCSPQETANLPAVGPVGEQAYAHHAARSMIHD
jgi:hypothetical protein